MDNILESIVKRFKREVDKCDDYKIIKKYQDSICINNLTITQSKDNNFIYYNSEMYRITKSTYDELYDLANKKRLDLLYKDINSDIVETESSFITMVKQIEEEKQQDE